MSEKIKVCWLTPEHNNVANALGYNSHNSSMRKWSQKYVDFDDTADIVLQIVPADKYIPVAGKINVLFTMWEFLDLPDTYIEGINKADIIIVPCSFCRDLFKRYTDKPIYVCHEGVDPDVYKFYQRRRPRINSGEKFRFLWVGAPNPRKGYPFILEAIKIFEKTPNIEIYMKTTVPKLNWKQTFVNIWKKRKLIFTDEIFRTSVWNTLRRLPRPNLADKVRVYGKHKNVFFDTRKLPIDELVALYNSSHCFLLPTFGEGWGLTLSEAMATGCPSIATGITGCSDFFDEKVGYPVKYDIRHQDLRDYKLKTRGYVPDTNDVVSWMLYVISHYDEALKRGKLASERICTKFTWERSAKRLYDILVDIQKTRKVTHGSGNKARG